MNNKEKALSKSINNDKNISVKKLLVKEEILHTTRDPSNLIENEKDSTLPKNSTTYELNDDKKNENKNILGKTQHNINKRTKSSLKNIDSRRNQKSYSNLYKRKINCTVKKINKINKKVIPTSKENN